MNDFWLAGIIVIVVVAAYWRVYCASRVTLCWAKKVRRTGDAVQSTDLTGRN